MTKPSKNKVTGPYSDKHRGIDYSGKGDSGVYAAKEGTIIQSINAYNTAWENTGKLTTRDYGNYIKMKHADGTFTLYAHMAKDSVLEAGTSVRAGERIGTIGNTGNSTGAHLHFEYRNSENINIEPVFEKESTMPDMMQISKADFERIRAGSERSEAVHKELGLEGDHVATPIEAFISAIKTLRGYQADATTMRGKLSKAEAEILNREEQVGRLKDQLLELEQLKQTEAAIYSNAVKAAEKLNTEYGLRLDSMQKELDQVYKDKGALQIRVNVLEADNKQLRDKGKPMLSRTQIIAIFIKKLIERIK
ncbi:M23 family metallopeptidase [Polynucleobacter sp.]|uniref:M23 family metallopeptidase n=1 Tax=Polynucleobacter sp. TaxID=2029855 RepID=UPI003F69885E